MSSSDLENPNMMHTKVGAIKSENCSDFGQKTVGIQRSAKTTLRVRLPESLQNPSSSRLLNQLEKYGVDVTEHHRPLKQGSALDNWEANL